MVSDLLEDGLEAVQVMTNFVHRLLSTMEELAVHDGLGLVEESDLIC